MMDTMFAKRLNDIIDKEGIKKTELADRVGVSRMMVYRWIEGLAVPKHDNLRKLSRALKTTPEFLLYGKELSIDERASDVDIFRLKKAVKIIRNAERLRGCVYPSVDFAEKAAEIYFRLSNNLDLDGVINVQPEAGELLNDAGLIALRDFLRVTVRHGENLSLDERDQVYRDAMASAINKVLLTGND